MATNVVQYKYIDFYAHFNIIKCMAKIKQNDQVTDKERLIRKTQHLTRPPRLEGAGKNKMMNPILKSKKVTRPE